MSESRAERARKTAELATGIVSQVWPASSERCSTPVEVSVQRGASLATSWSSTLFLACLEYAALPPADDALTPAAVEDTSTDCVFDSESFPSLALPGETSAPSGVAAVTSTICLSLPVFAAYSSLA